MVNHFFFFKGRYCIDNTGFIGIYCDQLASILIEEYLCRDNEYFLFAIHPDNTHNLILYTTRGQREIKGSDLDAYYSKKSVYKPITESIYNMI